MAKRLQIQFYNESTGESLTLPINPANVSMPSEMNSQSYDVIDYGEVVRIGGRRAKRVTFKNLFPEDEWLSSILPTTFSNIISNIYSMFFGQKDTIDKINNWAFNKDKIRVIVSDYYNELMQIESFSPEVSENNLTVHYNLNFVEYRDPNDITNLGASSLGSTGLLIRSAIRAIPNSYIANSADDLYSVAKRFTGDGANWKSIASVNNIIDGDSSILGKEINLKW